MSSDEYGSRANANPEKTPLEKMCLRYSQSIGFPFPLRFEQYTAEQKLAIVLERLIAQQKETLLLMQVCIMAAQNALQSKRQALQNWCDAYTEHFNINRNDEDSSI